MKLTRQQRRQLWWRAEHMSLPAEHSGVLDMTHRQWVVVIYRALIKRNDDSQPELF